MIDPKLSTILVNVTTVTYPKGFGELIPRSLRDLVQGRLGDLAQYNCDLSQR